MEQTTELYRYLKSKNPGLIGSEYLGDAVPLGETDFRGIRNEDATALTFGDSSLAAILSFDVFEHIYAVDAAFQECYRTLRHGGTMIWTAPFDMNSAENIERAVFENGTIHHLLPPEYHGDPLSTDGVLCFRCYGWSMLEDLRRIGFREVCGLVFHSVRLGYLTNQIVFYARK
jgi:SAM-dependent methyltransferase